MKIPEGWSEEQFKKAINACKNADENFVPLYIKNSTDVRKLLYEIRKYKNNERKSRQGESDD